MHPERAAEVSRDGGQAISLSQPLGPHNMRCQVAVAEPEPARTAQALHLLHESPCLACNPPSGLRIGDIGERIHHCIDVRQNMQTHMLEIIASIDQHGKPLTEQLRQPGGKLRAAPAAGERQHSELRPCCHVLSPAGWSNVTNSAGGLRALTRPGRNG